MSVALLAGGTGGAKLASGLASLLPDGELSIIVNTADDDEFWGLPVSPDVDAILYRLSGVFNERSGFGVADDTFNALAMLRRLGEPDWFALGDFDIGLQLLRAQLLRRGLRLTEAVAEIARRLRLTAHVLPMSDQPVRTRLTTNDGELGLQQWFVQHKSEPLVRSLRFDGIDSATASPEAIDAVDGADLVVIGPSNPLLSIDPIVALLTRHLDRARVVAVSPIVAGRSLKGPTVAMMRWLGEAPTATGVAHHYAHIAATFALDSRDAAEHDDIAAAGMRVVICDTVMDGAAGERRLAEEILRLRSASRAS